MGTADVLIAGLGSAHGDDQAGWLVVDELVRRGIDGCVLRKLTGAHELLEELDSFSAIYVIDSCGSSECPGQVELLDWQQLREVRQARWSTHGPGLSDVLTLAMQLTPGFSATIRIGIVGGAYWAPLSTPSREVCVGAKRLAGVIWDEVNGKRLHMSLG